MAGRRSVELLVAVLVSLVAAVVLIEVVLVLVEGRRPGEHAAPVATAPTNRTYLPKHGSAGAKVVHARGRRKALQLNARLLLRAARGASYVELRRGSSAGQLVFQGVVKRGGSVRASGPGLWLRLGAGANVDVFVGGTRQDLLGAAEALITARGPQLLSAPPGPAFAGS